MRTSPLENLLIEHPSMSVYHFHPSKRHLPPALLAAREASEASKRREEEAARAAAEAAENVRQELTVEERLPRLTCTPILQEVQQHLLSKQAQKVRVFCIFIYCYISILIFHTYYGAYFQDRDNYIGQQEANTTNCFCGLIY